jgi:hypothetical protein
MIGREIRDRLIGQGENPDTAFVRAIATAVRLPAKKDYGSPEKLHAALLDDMDKQLVRLESFAAGPAGQVLIHKVATERNAAGLRSLGADMIAMDAI